MKQLKRLFGLALLACAPMLLTGTHVYAQAAGLGSILGSVVDASGQVVPGATITVTNEQTGEVRNGTSNEVGDYTFSALQPGPYTVHAELSGFKPYEIKNNQVLANNRLSMRPLRLEVGTLAETVSVTAVGETLATTVTSHQALLESSQIENMAIKGRDPISLLKILPGVQLQANDQDTFGGSFATGVPNIQGAQGGNGQTLYVDGINGGDGGASGGGGGNFSAATNIDAIEEVNVQMSSYTAEYGLKGGAQVNIITKHGGSVYHGTGYWYKRHEMWNATNFFNNKAGKPKPNYRYSTLGGTLGGPVPKISRINEDGKKLFFFYSIDDTQLKDAQNLKFYTMPTALERAGDFSQSFTPTGTLIQVIDPLTGKQFTDNKIPLDRMDPRGVQFLNLFPLPNTTGVPGYNYVTQEPSFPHPRRQHILRVDWRPTDRNSLSVKYQTFYTKSVGINVAGASARWGLVRQRYDFFTDVAKLDYTRIINTRTVLEFSTGFYNGVEDGPPEDDKALAGIQRSSYAQFASLTQFAPQNNPLGLIPQAAFGNVPSADRTSSNDGGTGQVTYDGRWPITGSDLAFNTSLSLTHTRGSHTYKTGVMREDELFGQARSGTFAGSFDFSDDSNDAGSTKYAYANAFVGHVRSYSESLGRVPDDRRQRTWAWFVQDTWKATHKLTLDYGVRMYKWSPAVSMGGEGSAFSFERFDPTWGGKPPVLYRPACVGAAPCSGTNRKALNPLTGELLPSTFIGLIVPGTGYSCTGTITPSTPCKINGIVTQRDGHYLKNGKEGFTEPLALQVDPRFGVAYAMNPKTVLRFGAGAFHDGTGGAYFQQGNGNAAFRYTRQVFFTDLSSYLNGASASSVVPNTNGIVRENPKRPNNIRFTAAMQREIGSKIVLDAAYVGTRSRYLSENFNYNAIPAGARFDPANRDTTVAATATNPAPLPDQFLRPIAGFSDIQIEQPTGHSRYDSLQIQVSRRFTGGLEMASSYTWARGYGHNLNQNNPLPSTMDRQDIQEHVLVMSYMYEVPSIGHRLGGGTVAKGILDNWRLSGVTTLGTGGRGNVSVTYSPAITAPGGEDCGRYNVTGNLVLPSGERTIDKWFNTSSIAPITNVLDVGNSCSPWKFALPGWTNHDVSLFKDFRIKRGQTMEYRLEIFNLLNTVQFQTVNTTATINQSTGAQTSSTFGATTAARNERRMQMSLRYRF